MTRMIKTVVNTGFANATHIDYEELPDNWDEMTQEEQENHLEEFAQDAVSNSIDACASVVEKAD